VSTSALLKTALYGEDAKYVTHSPIPHHSTQYFLWKAPGGYHAILRSWGRVLAAVGSIQDLTKPLEPARVNVLFVPDDGSPALLVLMGGEPENVDEDRAKEILSEGKFEIKIQLGIGEESAKYWTCDFSYVSSVLSFRGVCDHGRTSICEPCSASFNLSSRLILHLWVLNLRVFISRNT
jgi:hypothetical protein